MSSFTRIAVVLLVAVPGLLWAQRPESVQRALGEADLRKRIDLLTTELNRAGGQSAYLFRAEAFSQLGHADLAQRDLTRARSMPAQEPSFLLETVAAIVALAVGDARTAFDAADRAVAQSPPAYLQPYYFRAQAGIRLERYVEAERDLQRYLSSFADNASALGLLADAQAGRRETQLALATLDRGLARHPNDPYLVQKKLLMLDRLGRRDSVEALAGRVTQFAPDDPLSQSNLGVVFQNAGDLPRALVYHTRALDLYQEKMKDAEFARTRAGQVYAIYLNRGNTHRLMGNPDAALADYRKATDLQPHRYEAWYWIGELQTTGQNYLEASEAFENCFARNPTLPDGWVNLSFAYMEQGKTSLALRTFDRALRLPNVSARGLLLNNRGFCHLELGHFAQAKADLEAAIATDARVAMSHISLGEYHMARREPESALVKFDHALTLPILDARERWTAHYQRGLIYLARADYARAEADFAAAIEALPDYREAHERRGEALVGLKRWCDARAAYRAALDRDRRMYPKVETRAAMLLSRLDIERPGPCQ